MSHDNVGKIIFRRRNAITIAMTGTLMYLRRNLSVDDDQEISHEEANRIAIEAQESVKTLVDRLDLRPTTTTKENNMTSYQLALELANRITSNKAIDPKDARHYWLNLFAECLDVVENPSNAFNGKTRYQNCLNGKHPTDETKVDANE